jgi:hypothetical protein
VIEVQSHGRVADDDEAAGVVVGGPHAGEIEIVGLLSEPDLLEFGTKGLRRNNFYNFS